jgi:hypothetical protein
VRLARDLLIAFSTAGTLAIAIVLISAPRLA